MFFNQFRNYQPTLSLQVNAPLEEVLDRMRHLEDFEKGKGKRTAFYGPFFVLSVQNPGTFLLESLSSDKVLLKLNKPYAMRFLGITGRQLGDYPMGMEVSIQLKSRPGYVLLEGLYTFQQPKPWGLYDLERYSYGLFFLFLLIVFLPTTDFWIHASIFALSHPMGWVMLVLELAILYFLFELLYSFLSPVTQKHYLNWYTRTYLKRLLTGKWYPPA